MDLISIEVFVNNTILDLNNSFNGKFCNFNNLKSKI